MPSLLESAPPGTAAKRAAAWWGLFLCLLLIPTGLSSAGPLASSHFGGGTDGWKIENNGREKARARKGALVGKEGRGNHTWYFTAPPKFLGNKSAAYGGWLEWEQLQTKTNSQTSGNDGLWLRGAGLDLVHKVPNPGATFSPYRIVFHPCADWTVRNQSSRPAKEEDLRRVLGDLEGLWIRGEFRIGEDESWIRNVVMRSGGGRRKRPEALRVFRRISPRKSTVFRSNPEPSLYIPPPHPHDKVPYHVHPPFRTRLKRQKGERILVAGTRDGTGKIRADNFMLFTLHRPGKTERFHFGAVQAVEHKGKRVRQIGHGFESPPVDLTEFLPERVEVAIEIAALDFGVQGDVGETFLVRVPQGTCLPAAPPPQPFPGFCRVHRQLEVARTGDAAPNPAQIAVRSTPPGAGHRAKDTGARIRFQAGAHPGKAEFDPGSGPISVTVWDLRRGPGEGPGRVNRRLARNRGTWHRFPFRIEPQGVDLASLVEEGEIRLQSLNSSSRSTSPPSPIPVDGSTGGIHATRVGDRSFFSFEDGALLWNGGAPEGQLISGRHALELRLRNGAHRATVRWEFDLETLSAPQDLTGYWEVEDGLLDDWIMRGRAFPRNRVALETAPDQAIRGTWRGPGEDATVDLRPAPPRPRSWRGLLEDRVRPPVVLRGLREASWGSGRRGFSLHGKPVGVPRDTLLLRKIPWEIRIREQFSTFWFDPEDESRAGTRAGRLEGGSLAQIDFRRFPEAHRPNAHRSLAVRARIRSSTGDTLHQVEAGIRARPTQRDAPFRVELDDFFTGGKIQWNGRDESGAPRPPGTYTVEAVVREGMAEQRFSWDIHLGQGVVLTEVPGHFAPGFETLPIRFRTVPAGSYPQDLTLRVRGGADFQTLLFEGPAVPRQDGDQWVIDWDGRETGGAPVRWATMAPFQVEVEARMRRGGELTSDRARTTVELGDLSLDARVPRPEGSESRSFYQENEISSDFEFLPLSAHVTLLSSAGTSVPVTSGFHLLWDFEWETVDSTSVPLRRGRHSHGTYKERRPSFFLGDGFLKVDPHGDHQGRIDVEVDGMDILFLMPARAAGWDLGPVEPDHFKISVQVEGLTERAETETYTMAPGAPGSLEQLPADDVASLAPLQELDVETWDKELYVENLETKIATFIDQPFPGLERAIRSALADFETVQVRFVGDVPAVPYRGLRLTAGSLRLPQVLDSIDLPVYFGGFAGSPQAEIRGGQALLAAFQLRDAFGNPIPVAGPRARRIQVEISSLDQGRVPPFILGSTGGERPLRYHSSEPFFPYTREPSIFATGVFPFYYVPGIVYQASDKLRKDLSELEEELDRYEEVALEPPIPQPIDDTVTARVLVDGKEVLTRQGLRLLDPEGFQAPVGEFEKLLKLIIAGEVTDADTLKLEIALSTIPIVGDGRDLAIYGLKGLFAPELSGWDHFFAAIALIGLVLDAGDFIPGGVAPNALMAALKSFGKRVRSMGGKFAEAFLIVTRPIVDAAREVVENASRAAIRKFVGSLEEMKRLVVLVVDSVDDGLTVLNRRLARMKRFIDGCNPHTCLECFKRWATENSLAILDWHAEGLPHFKRLQDKLLELRRGAEAVDQVLGDLMKLSKRLIGAGLDTERRSMRAIEDLAEYASLLDEPVTFVRAFTRLSASQFRKLAEVLDSPSFRAAVRADPDLLKVFADAVRKNPQDAATLFTKLGGSVENLALLKGVVRTAGDSLPDLAMLFRRIDRDTAARTLRHLHEFLAPPAGRPLDLSKIGGAKGFRDLLHIGARLAEGGAVEAAQRTIKVATELLRVRPVINGHRLATLTTLTDLRRLFDNAGLSKIRVAGPNGARLLDGGRELATKRWDLYMQAIDAMRYSDGRLKLGIFEPMRAASGRANGATSNVIAARNNSYPIDFMVEIVGTWWMATRGGGKISVSGAAEVTQNGVRATRHGDLTFSLDDVIGFGYKGQRRVPGGGIETFEGDTLIRINGELHWVDWKNYLRSSEDALGGKVHDFRKYLEKAIHAITTHPSRLGAADRGVHKVVYLRTSGWERSNLELLETIWRGSGQGRKGIADMDEAILHGFGAGRGVLLGEIGGPVWRSSLLYQFLYGFS